MAAHALTTRRSALADLIGLAFLSTATGAAAADLVSPADPDAELIRLGAELARAWKAEDAIRHEFVGRSTFATEELVEKASDVSHAVVERILAVPALTLDGIRVKARAVEWCYGGEPVTCDGECAATSERMMASIVNDLLRWPAA